MVRNVFVCVFLFFSISVFSQYSISGRVSDNQGEALVGANVFLKEINKGVSSSINGDYLFKDIPSGSYTLMVSYIGYFESEQKITVDKDLALNIELKTSIIQGEEIIVRSTRAGNTTPTTFTELNQEEINSKNLGQDLPFLFGMEPSLVYTSDAGAGVGYTGLWIRGSNIQRINVTVNGIPLNDPESHGVFFVNMPDFASSLEGAQIQRGVGTSTNGGGAFGATINLETNHHDKEAFGEINSSYGSFNTFKNNVRFGSGLIKDKWAFEGRLSQISSDGYIDRASSDLKSFFVQAGYYGEKTTVKAVVFSGKEKTYQAWWGVDDWTVENLGRTYNWAGAIFNEDDSTSYYDNQTDNYQQDHYQLHLTQKLATAISFNVSWHYTYGRGFYEEYNQQDDLSNYPMGVQYFGLDSVLVGSNYELFYHDTIGYSDLITRRWLDNQFYGATYSINYSHKYVDLTLGGAYNLYANAKHYGEVIWAQYAGDSKIRDEFYHNSSDKADFNTYLKANIKPVNELNIFVDFQVRNVEYTGSGTDKGGTVIDIDESYLFFNPKIGASYNTSLGMLFASAAVANREPIRSDFLDATEGVKPQPERLIDYELGIRKTNIDYFYNANFYLMQYANQLVLTGALNDVGSPIRENVGKSTRMGIELDGGISPIQWFSARANIALSNSTTDFKREEDSAVVVSYNNVQLSYSPQAIFGAELSFMPVQNVNASFIYKYISKQYLDLTESDSKALDAYQTLSLQLSYGIHPAKMEEIKFTLQINNLLNAMYASNGYIYDETLYYYPQAGINFLAGICLKF
jgi:iron complex outermembrane recepter protein